MIRDILILAAPIVLCLGLWFVWAAVDTRRWNASCRAASAPQPVRLFPEGPAPLAPPINLPDARVARRARHARTTGGTR